jgi:hypothetical protein
MVKMTSGGARSVSGPPPDPNALRRNRAGDAATWTSLPAAGREGDPPDWPLTDLDGRETELWTDLWSRPQAVMWERLSQTYEVAMCVRMLARAEAPRSSVELQKVVRQYFDSLGLTTQGMLRNRWRIEQAAPAAAPVGRLVPAKTASSRSRLKVVHGDDESL